MYRQGHGETRIPTRRAKWLAIQLATALMCLTADAWAAGGKPATKLVNVADTRDMSGITKWFGDVYNTDLILFGLVVVVVMSGLGGLLGLVFDRAVGMLGINLGKLDHHE